MRFALALSLCVLGCAAPAVPGDAGSSDAGVDAGRDAGRDAGVVDAGIPDAGFQDIGIEQWCAARALAECFRDVRCLRVADAGVDECVARKLASCDQAAFTLAVKTSHLQYLKGAAVACLNGFHVGSCEDPPAGCVEVFAGLAPPDAGCLLDEECNADGFCDLYDGRCPHHCQAWATMGQSCNGFTTRCRPGFETCQTGDGGEERCAPFRNEGQSCDDYDDCREDLICLSNSCVKRSAKPGEACGQTSGFPTCPAEYFCRQQGGTNPPPGVCEKRAGLGGVCAGYSSCLPSLHCSGVFQTGTCEARAAVGDKCAGFYDCQEDLFCAPSNSRCTPLPRDGGDCSNQGSFYECASGYFCDFNVATAQTCEARRALGDSCTYDSVCLSNKCESGRCTLSCAVKLLADAGQ